MLSAALLLIFVGVLPKAIDCSPVDEYYHGGVLNVPKAPECIVLTDHYCSQVLNYSTVYLPNPRGHKTLDEAKKEFNDFIPLLQSGCHPKLATFLCFTYFPLCYDYGPNPPIKIYPCKEVCEEVAGEDTNCTAIVDQYNGWNDQLQCNKSHFKPKSSRQCNNGGSSESSDDSTEPPVTTGNSTDSEEPTESEEQCGSAACPSSCDYRGNANSGTYKRNAYCYAAKVTVKSYAVQGCHHAYNVEVEQQYDLQTPFNATHSTKAPSMGDSAVILTSPSHCRDSGECPKLELSKTYLISGPYSRAADGSVQWKLGDIKAKALVSEWVSRYDRKSPASFVSGGNAERASNRADFLKEKCEMDAQLVSAEQWIHHQ